MLIDANARVGSNTSSACGDHWPQPEDEAGRQLTAILRSSGMTLPQTFSTCCTGQVGHTWSSKLAGRHRIDYVAVPLQALPFSVAEVSRDPRLTGGVSDHSLVTVATRVLLRAVAGLASRRRGGVCRALVQHPI